MKINKRRLAIIALLSIGLLCSLIASYFYFSSHPLKRNDLTQLLDFKKGDEATQTDKTLQPTGQKIFSSAESDLPQGPSDTGASQAGLGDIGSAGLDPDAHHDAGKYALPSPRIAPNMFAFSSLRNNAPVAQFPLELVGQKNLEWYRTRGANEGGTINDGQLSIHRRPPPGRPPPPGPPPGPPGPPGPPPGPPPEVSTSGL